MKKEINIRNKLHIFQSNKHYYIQILSSDLTKTIFSISTLKLKLLNKNFKNITKILNLLLKFLQENNISKLSFYRIIKKNFKQRYKGNVRKSIEFLRLNNIVI